MCRKMSNKVSSNVSSNVSKIAWWLLGLSLLWPSLAFAQAQGSFSPITLTPPDTDLSYIYLSNLFGVVDGVLAGTGGQLLGSLFGVFNSAILIVAGVVLGYTFFSSTINTAHEGEVMGKKWSSIWIPLRSVAGIALLIPKASGYSFIQIFLMWIIVQGVGAADSIWNSALDYLLRGGIVIQQNQSFAGSADKRQMVSTAATMLRSLTCSAMLQAQFELYRKNVNPNLAAPPNFLSETLTAFQGVGPSGSIAFPTTTANYYGTDGACGSIQWDAVTLPGFMMGGYVNGQRVVKPEYVSVKQAIEQSRTLAVQQMYVQLYPYAQSIVGNYMAPPEARKPLGKVLEDGSWGAGSIYNPKPYLISGSVVAEAAAAYYGIMTASLNLNNVNNTSQGWMKSAREEGWIMAGTYYYDIVALNNGVQSITENAAPRIKGPSNSLTSDPKIYNYIGGSASPYVANIQDLVNNNKSEYTVGENSPFISGAKTYGSNMTFGNVGSFRTLSQESDEAVNEVLSIFTMGMYDIVEAFIHMFQAQQTNANPVVAIALLGGVMVSVAVGISIAMALAFYYVGMALGALWGFALAAAMVGIVMPVVSLFTPILLAMIAAGFVMSYYIPLIPFFLFTLAAIGWFVTVVEAIIAAPLIALGIAHPEGHEIFGKAEQGMGLMLTAFLRPTLLIFGLLFGMMLTYVSVWLINQGFQKAFFGYAQANIRGLGWIFVPVAIVFLYVGFIVVVVQRVFMSSLSETEILRVLSITAKATAGDLASDEAKIQRQASTVGETGGKGATDSPGSVSSGLKSGGEGQKDYASMREEPAGNTEISGKAKGGGDDSSAKQSSGGSTDGASSAPGGAAGGLSSGTGGAPSGTANSGGGGSGDSGGIGGGGNSGASPGGPSGSMKNPGASQSGGA